MRDAIQKWVTTYPREPGWRDGTFEGAPEARFVERDVPAAIRAAVPDLSCILVKGSAGQGGWTDTPWVALLDPAVTTTVQEGFYVVYLMSLGCDRLYLTIAQGCTELKNRSGIPAARDELIRIASLMRSRVEGRTQRLRPLDMKLGTKSWRGKLYEAGLVVGTRYDTAHLPSESALRADLEEALRLYRHLSCAGGWWPDDEIMIEARDEHGAATLAQAKRYRQHRTIERQRGHSDKVKAILGTRCMGCRVELRDRYGETAAGLIDAHHLVPLSSLEDGKVARYNPSTDFAVLCPNCHRVIHRMPDVADISGLQRLIEDRRNSTGV